MTDLFDAAAQPAASPELRDHLALCPACAREFEQFAATLAALAPPVSIRASADFKERTMDKLNDRLAADSAAHIRRGRLARIAWRVAAVAAVIAIAVTLPYLSSPGGGQSSPMALLAQSAQAMSKVESVHMIARMRNPPRDNFEAIGTQYDFIPIEMWKQSGGQPKWRIEKSDRVVVMDGTQCIQLTGGAIVDYGRVDAGFVDFLKPLLDADKVLAGELAAARAGQSKAALAENMHGAARRLVLTAVYKAQGDFTNDWLRNATITQSDHTRQYSFDAATNRLTGLSVLVHDGGERIPVLEVTEIRYNEVLDPKLFTIKLPSGVVRSIDPEQLPKSAQPLPATPREAAVAFLEGIAAKDWDRVQSVSTDPLTKKFKDALSGMQVISIGEPFKSGQYVGWFVPYEVRFADGTYKKYNLAVRNDNEAKRFHTDGGF
jgi:hypothetical protein